MEIIEVSLLCGLRSGISLASTDVVAVHVNASSALYRVIHLHEVLLSSRQVLHDYIYESVSFLMKMVSWGI